MKRSANWRDAVQVYRELRTQRPQREKAASAGQEQSVNFSSTVTTACNRPAKTSAGHLLFAGEHLEALQKNIVVLHCSAYYWLQLLPAFLLPPVSLDVLLNVVGSWCSDILTEVVTWGPTLVSVNATRWSSHTVTYKLLFSVLLGITCHWIILISLWSCCVCLEALVPSVIQKIEMRRVSNGACEAEPCNVCFLLLR